MTHRIQMTHDLPCEVDTWLLMASLVCQSRETSACATDDPRLPDGGYTEAAQAVTLLQILLLVGDHRHVAALKDTFEDTDYVRLAALSQDC